MAPLPTDPQPILLLVEDEPDTADLVKMIMMDEGYLVVHVADGQEALDKIAMMPIPTVAVLDIQLPHVDGITILKTIRSIYEWQTVPVVMLTAVADAEYVRTVSALNVQGYLLKPFKRESLVRKIEHARTLARP